MPTTTPFDPASIEHGIRIPVHRDAAYRVAAILAEPVANRRRITLELTIKHHPDGSGLTANETVSAIPTRLVLEHTDALGPDFILATYTATLEAAAGLLELIATTVLDAPPSARTDPYSGALRTLELELLVTTGDVVTIDEATTGTLEVGPTAALPGSAAIVDEALTTADPVPAPDQG